MTILVVVCSYLHIVTFLAVCKFLNFNVMNFKIKKTNDHSSRRLFLSSHSHFSCCL